MPRQNASNAQNCVSEVEKISVAQGHIGSVSAPTSGCVGRLLNDSEIAPGSSDGPLLAGKNTRAKIKSRPIRLTERNNPLGTRRIQRFSTSPANKETICAASGRLIVSRNTPANPYRGTGTL